MLHGRLIGGLAARELESAVVPEGWRVARLTVDMLRPASLAELRVEHEIVRQGRRIIVADVSVHSDGHLVGRVTGLVLAEGDEPPGTIWQPDLGQWPTPESVPPPEDQLNPRWDIRYISGGFNTGKRSRLWSNDYDTLVDDEALTPLVRAALAGDIACPISNSSDQGLYYINADYTMLLSRYPRGPWIGLETDTQMASGGISVAGCIYVDEDGPFAISHGASLSRPALENE